MLVPAQANRTYYSHRTVGAIVKQVIMHNKARNENMVGGPTAKTKKLRDAVTTSGGPLEKNALG